MPSPLDRRVIVTALVLAMAMSAMEATVVATAMPSIVAELSGIALYGWVGAAYLLAATVTVPVFGRLADMRGRKPVMLGGVALFVIGSLACGLATSMESLIAARALQGLGAGAMQPVSMTIVGDLFRIEERSKVQGLFGAVWATAGVAGPLLGAFFVETLSWRWVFLINLPFGIAAMAVLFFAFREPGRPASESRLDVLGSVVLLAASVALLVGAGGTLTWLLVPTGVVLGIAFFAVERRVSAPILPMSLVRERPIAVGASASLVFGALMMTLLIYGPLYVQGARGGGPTEAGAIVAPMMIGWPVAATTTSRFLVRVGFRTPLWIGSFLCAVTIVIFATLASWHAPLPALAVTMLFFGAGMGLANTSFLIAMQSTVGFAQRGVSTALALFARSMGGALGVGAAGGLVAVGLAGRVSPEAAAALLSPHGDGAAASPAVAAALDASLQTIFWILAVAAVGNLAVVALWPRAVVTVEDPPVGAPAAAE